MQRLGQGQTSPSLKMASKPRQLIHRAWRVPKKDHILTIFLSLIIVFAGLNVFLFSTNLGSPISYNEKDSHPLAPRSSLGDPSNKGEVMNDSSHATVMGMATGYTLSTYQSFVGSLRKSGFKGNIILVIAQDPNPGVESYLKSRGVTMKKLKIVDCAIKSLEAAEVKNAHHQEVITCADPYPYLKVRWGRFPILRDLLMECKDCTGPVLITDVRDTYFQRDPFGDGAPMVTGLQVFEEHKTMRTTNWLVEWPVDKCKGIKFDEPMLCSGTTIGTRQAVLDYLQIMHNEMKDWMEDKNCCCNGINGDDQSIHNYLFYTGKLPMATAFPNRMGIVQTVGHQAALIEKSWLGLQFDLVDEDGYFTNYDGSRSRVIHQYDRFKSQLKNWLRKSGMVDEKGKGPLRTTRAGEVAAAPQMKLLVGNSERDKLHSVQNDVVEDNTLSSKPILFSSR
jgi:hypothetical protein